MGEGGRGGGSARPERRSRDKEGSGKDFGKSTGPAATPISFPEHACSRVRYYLTREQAYSGNEIAATQASSQISTCERAYSLRAVWPAEEVVRS